MISTRALGFVLFVWAALLPSACGSTTRGTGSETHWLAACDSDAQCEGSLKCVCGTCTLPCSGKSECQSLGASATCASASAVAVVCAGSTAPADGLCLNACTTQASCSSGTSCVGGACVPNPSSRGDASTDADGATGGSAGAGGSTNIVGAGGAAGESAGAGGITNIGGADGGSRDGAAPDGSKGVVNSPDTPVPPDPSECDMLSFHARMDASGAPFQVPTGDHYYCFSFHQSLNSGAQGLGFYSDADNTAVVHDWRLYKMAEAQTDGSSSECSGVDPDGELVSGWTVGLGGDWFLPASVGMDLGAGDFILEVHYNNAGPPTTDASGVHVCKAKTPRPETATVSWLGADIWPVGSGLLVPAGATPQSYTAGSTCSPANQTAPIHILRSWPHMHKAGVRMTSTINRLNGDRELIVDHDFSVDTQRAFDTPAILYPGESIRTDCFYDNQTGATIEFGQSTSQEECYDFVIAYPARALTLPGNPLHSTACIPSF